MWIHLVASFFLIPISLNFINIATDQPLKFKWEISVITQINLFFLQIILPSVDKLNNDNDNNNGKIDTSIIFFQCVKAKAKLVRIILLTGN
jgi:hypothetical protein